MEFSVTQCDSDTVATQPTGPILGGIGIHDGDAQDQIGLGFVIASGNVLTLGHVEFMWKAVLQCFVPNRHDCTFFGSGEADLLPSSVSGTVTGPLGTFTFKATCSGGSGCSPLNVASLRQDDPLWVHHPYDKTPPDSIGNKGCGLTSLCVALAFQGVPCRPDVLNDFMNLHNDYYGNGKIDWEAATRDFAGNVNPSLKFKLVASNPSDELKTLVCNNWVPVVVGVNLSGGLNQYGLQHAGHFVVVTGWDGNDFNIWDPNSKKGFTTLGQYGAFQTRGWIGDPQGNLSSLVLTVDNALLQIVDPAARQTGFDPVTKQRVQAIPNSACFLDALGDDATGAPPHAFSSYLQISQPADGPYESLVIGTGRGVHTLSLRSFTADGSSQAGVSIPVITDSGSTSSFEVSFSSVVGSSSQLVRVATVGSVTQDIHVSRLQGLIDNDGVEKALLTKIEDSAAASARGQVNASRNILTAFEALVKAQTGKHLTALAGQILTEDADWLLSHTQ